MFCLITASIPARIQRTSLKGCRQASMAGMKETHQGERERQMQWIGFWWLPHCSTYRRQLSLHCYLFFCLQAQFFCFLTVHFCSSCTKNCYAGLVVNKLVNAEGTYPVMYIQKSFPYEKILWGRQGSSLGNSGNKTDHTNSYGVHRNPTIMVLCLYPCWRNYSFQASLACYSDSQ